VDSLVPRLNNADVVGLHNLLLPGSPHIPEVPAPVLAE
jgi:hypothetical protein